MTKGSVVVLTGNTFPHREAIKGIGGHWDPVGRCWVVRAGGMSDRARQSRVLHELEKQGVRVTYAMRGTEA